MGEPLEVTKPMGFGSSQYVSYGADDDSTIASIFSKYLDGWIVWIVQQCVITCSIPQNDKLTIAIQLLQIYI